MGGPRLSRRPVRTLAVERPTGGRFAPGAQSPIPSERPAQRARRRRLPSLSRVALFVAATMLTRYSNVECASALVRTVCSHLEFKLYTGIQAEADIMRLRVLRKKLRARASRADCRVPSHLLASISSPESEVCSGSVRCFSKKFKIAGQALFEIDEFTTVDREGLRRPGRWPVGFA
jgi:hypothetical protein